MMKFSVIIPFYNVESYLNESIESVINQSYTTWELILIDDGSKDKSHEIALQYANIDARIKLFSHAGNENKGVSASRNLGIEVATGEWIAFLDADDIWYPEKLMHELEIIKKNARENCVLIYSRTQIIMQEKSDLRGIFGSGSIGLTRNPFIAKLKGFHAHTSNLLVKSETLRRHKIVFNEKMNFAEDTLFMHEVLLYGNLYFSEEILSYFRVNNQSATNSMSSETKISGRFNVYLNLLNNKESLFTKEISYEFIHTGFEKIWKYFLLNPVKHSKLFFNSLSIVINNPKVLLKHKLVAFLMPFFLLFKYLLRKIRQ